MYQREKERREAAGEEEPEQPRSAAAQKYLQSSAGPAGMLAGAIGIGRGMPGLGRGGFPALRKTSPSADESASPLSGSAPKSAADPNVVGADVSVSADGGMPEWRRKLLEKKNSNAEVTAAPLGHGRFQTDEEKRNLQSSGGADAVPSATAAAPAPGGEPQIPEWRRKLLEKKSGAEAAAPAPSAPEATPAQDAPAASENIPAWKRKLLEKKASETTLPTATPSAAPAAPAAGTVPEWKRKLLEKKASSGALQ
jgi:hypothetical protein